MKNTFTLYELLHTQNVLDSPISIPKITKITRKKNELSAHQKINISNVICKKTKYEKYNYAW